MSAGISMVTHAVAAGTFAEIELWTKLLRQAGIHYEVRWFCDEHRTQRDGRAELWVDQFEIEKARSAIRSAPDADSSLIW